MALVHLSIRCVVLVFAVSSCRAFAWWSSPEFGVLQKMFDDCSHDKIDPAYCLKNKAATAVERALSRNLSLVDGVVWVRKDDARDMSSTAFEVDPDQRVVGALKKLLKSHVLTLDLTKIGNEEESMEQRGGDGLNKKKLKKKGKKIVPYVLMAALTALTIFGPIAVKTLTIIAGKALLASKLALMISGIILLKKLFSSDHHESTFQVHTVPDHGHRRSVDNYGSWDILNDIDPFKSRRY